MGARLGPEIRDSREKVGRDANASPRQGLVDSCMQVKVVRKFRHPQRDVYAKDLEKC
jgi:hypothetical protein